jgi:hypothetical protein
LRNLNKRSVFKKTDLLFTEIVDQLNLQHFPIILFVSLLFSKAKKVGQKCLCTITAFSQPTDPDQSTKRQDQDPKCNPVVVLQTLQD